MITLSKSGNTVTFTFDENSGYLQNGTIDVPINSLSLILDESDMATFRKSASNDIFVSALVGDFGMSKSELEAWYKENMVGSTGGGGVTPEEVQGMIDESISGKADTSAVTADIAAAVSGKIDSESAVTNVKVLTVSQQNEVQIAQSKGDSTASTFVGTVYRVGSGLTWNYQTKEFAVDSSTVALKSDIPSTSGFADAVAYDTNTKYMKFYNGGTGGTMVYQFDASPFLIDGMVESVAITSVTSGQTEAALVWGEEEDNVAFLPEDCTTVKFVLSYEAQIAFKNPNQVGYMDVRYSNGSVNVIDFQFEGGTYEISGSNMTVSWDSSANVFMLENLFRRNDPTVYAITGGTEVEVLQITWNSAAGGQVTNIPLSELGGATYTAGRGINIDTANTISFSLPISAGTGTNSIAEGQNTTASGSYSHAEGGSSVASGYYSHAEGSSSVASGYNSHAEGEGTSATSLNSHAEGSYTIASGMVSHAEGRSTIASGSYSHAEGEMTKANNQSEHASGQYNVSNTGSTDADKTLFSVGNGTYNARHNAFEIRQNGDIYFSKDGQDVKLQDQLGGGEVSSAITSGDTNAVAGGAVYDKFDEVEQVTARALNQLSEGQEVAARALIDLNDKFGGLKLQKISQTAYDNLQTKDANTLYVIVN